MEPTDDELNEHEGSESEMEDEDHLNKGNEEEDELAMFTRDGVGKLADDVTSKPKFHNANKATQPNEETKDGQSHFKSVLKELEENVSDDDEDSQDEGGNPSGKVTPSGELKRAKNSYDKERQYFIYVRVKAMTEFEYQDFIQCRQTKFFSKGIKPVMDWLHLKREGTELKFRKVLEVFGYIMRYIVQKIIL